MLAGISADYYLRLEQGRDRKPSAQVLESLARVLQLGEEGTAYLLSLGADKTRPRRRTAARENVPPSTAAFMTSLPFPAFIEGRYLDVLAANSLATALSPRLVAGANRLRDLFLDPAERTFFPPGNLPRSVWSPGSVSRSPRRSTRRVRSNSSANSPSPALDSGGSGPGTTWGPGAARRCGSTIPRWAGSSCIGRSS